VKKKKEFVIAKNNYRKIEEKIRNMINDIHYKAINKLMEYSIICIPKINIKNILEKDQINKKAKRILQAESHGILIRRLKIKGEKKGVEIRIIKEYLTTKTCSKCFSKNNPLKSKIYECIECGQRVDRDHNASKNIYIQEIEKIILEIIMSII
jgi:putative transposase